MAVGTGWELPAGSEPWSDFHWFQASTKETMEIVLLSSEPTWYTGHFVGGRMCPCTGKGCEYCGAGIGAQVRYVFSVAEMKTRRVGLIEFGRTNGLLICDWIARSGQLRGMVLEVGKHGSKVQSRTVITYVEHVCPPWYLQLSVPDAQLALFLTWHKAGMEMPEQFRERMKDRAASVQQEKYGDRRFPIPRGSLSG